MEEVSDGLKVQGEALVGGLVDGIMVYDDGYA